MKKRMFLGALLITLPLFAMADHDLTDSVLDEAKYEKSPRAQYALGMMYLQGQGVEQSDEQALSWLGKSSEQGYSLAAYRLGKIYLDDNVAKADAALAVKHITQAAQKGYSPSQYLLGTLYQTGQQGVKENKETAKKWFSLAADQGHKMAKLTLAKLSSEGGSLLDAQAAYDKGFKFLKGKDYKEAAEWFGKAAKQGNADAQYNLGELYKKGRGVKRNKKTAQKWYKAASAQGHVKAKYRTKGCAFC